MKIDNKKYKYLFGPVPSRRLGRSLGVDIVPLKTCTQNCIYCQLGQNGIAVTDRKPYVDIDVVVTELKDRLAAGLDADYITVSGSGEPTLNSDIGRLIEKIKSLTDIPVAVITNGTLLNDPQVRLDILDADAVLPSLDAGDEQTFRAINCPHTDLTLKSLVEGLIAFRKEYKGQMWLEVFFCEGVNSSDEQIEKIRSIIADINPDKVQLNTAVRPTVEKSAIAVSKQKLTEIAKLFGPSCQVIASFPSDTQQQPGLATGEMIVELLKRRPCTIEGMAQSLNVSIASVTEVVSELQSKSIIKPEQKGTEVFYLLM